LLEEVAMEEVQNDPPTNSSMREVPIDWEALENAFENNAPEVHSYLQVITGDVLRIVDGVADPQMHARIASDTNYLRIEAVLSREQYRWMERYIPTVEEPKLRSRLEVAIDGKGAFRRFKDVLMAFSAERERWFTYRSERLRTFMGAWLQAHNINPIARVQWVSTEELEEEGESTDLRKSALPESQDFRRYRSIDSLRRRLRDLSETLGPRDLDSVVAFAEFLRARRNARSFAQHTAYQSRQGDSQEDFNPSSSMGIRDESAQEVSENSEDFEEEEAFEDRQIADEAMDEALDEAMDETVDETVPMMSSE
jgi:hypothetical protein